MMKRFAGSSSSALIGQAMHPTHSHMMTPSQLVPGIERAEFALRRKMLCERVLSAQSEAPSAMIFVSNEEKYYSHDASHKFHQNSTFSYLFGFQEPQSVAVLVPSTAQFYLFSRNHDPIKEMWDGAICGPQRALNLFECENTFGIDVLSRVLPALVPEMGSRSPVVVSADTLFARQVDTLLLRKVNETLQLSNDEGDENKKRTRAILEHCDLLRMTKSEAELACIRKACEITGRGHKHAMEQRMLCKTEKQMQCEVEYGFGRESTAADGVFYSSIVAGGPRACTLHYTANDMQFNTEQGELCLIDAGARLLGGQYGGDVTRTFPVLRQSFTAAERDVYLAVHDTLEHIVEITTAGVSFQDLQTAALLRLQRNLQFLFNGECSVEQTRKYFPHGIGHFLGLDVHDTPTIKRTENIPAGAVITVEPGLYFPANDLEVPKHLRGIGIRLEDNIVVRSSGSCENLTRKHVPVDLEQVERLG